ncbi:Uncharacterised protein [Burkholderia pseudomallei]|nr:Uncharacterised protein [Burkholderia pseudomallei]CAJ3803484.1 Uncharacterised protein [Burkholderia pseudomallei]CAJ5009566.1 Uncharacterised protein [Burkholderia pseudomallei]CAJ5597135.1 Uncharacterised protein [Burkholderia pseudomallei]CAJ8342531.1 Uncharacterised protein [Burkholderia pseudomallei]
MHDPYHPAGRPRADERPAARRATPVRIRHMLLHFGAIGRGPGDARRCPRGAARGRAPMNRTASDSADCPAPFQPTPDAAMHAGSPAVHRSAARRGAARRGAETSKRAGTISSSHRRDSADRRERHRFRTHGMPRARVAMRRGTAGRHAASRRDSARRRARVPRISAIDPAPPPQAVPFHRRAALRQAGTSRPPFRSFQEMHRSKLPAQSFPFAHRRPFPL